MLRYLLDFIPWTAGWRLRQRVKRMVKEDRWISAIREVRTARPGTSLKVAKAYVWRLKK